MSLYNHPTLKSRRRLLRRNFTDAERLLWSKLRHRQLMGVKFFRQYSVGQYILDFYAPTQRLAIEVDGGQHGEIARANHDRQRTEYLQQLRITVIRFQNIEVLKNIDGVIEQVTTTLANPSSSPLILRGGKNNLSPNPSQPPLAPRGGDRPTRPIHPIPPLDARGGRGS